MTDTEVKAVLPEGFSGDLPTVAQIAVGNKVINVREKDDIWTDFIFEDGWKISVQGPLVIVHPQRD